MWATATLDYIIRDHDRERFEEHKRIMEQAAALMTPATAANASSFPSPISTTT